jgi:hypothetical protein
MLLSVFRRRFDKSFEYRVAKANCNNSMVIEMFSEDGETY